MASRSLGTLTLDLVAKTGGFERGMDKAARESERRMRQMQASAKRAGQAIGRALAVGAAAGGVALAAYIKMADEMSGLNARLRLATNGQEAYNRAQTDTFRIAQTTGTAIGSVIDLYARASQASEMLGLNQEQTARLTESVSKALAISGTQGAQSAAVILQLSQALAAGRVQAEEFNSIIDGAPRIVQALADHLGIAFGEVKKHVTEGKVSSQDLAAALLAASKTLDAEYSQMPLTVGRAIEQVRNSLKMLVGDTDAATGASSGLAGSISHLADVLGSEGVRSGFNSFVSGITTATAALVELMSTTSNLMTWLGESVARAQGMVSIDDALGVQERLSKINDALETRRSGGGRWAGVARTFTKWWDPLEAQEQARLAAMSTAELEAERQKLLGFQRQQQEWAAAGARARQAAEQARIASMWEQATNVTAPSGGGAASTTATAAGMSEAEKEARKLEAAYGDLIARQLEQIALYGQTSEAARVRYEVEHGALKDLSQAQKGVAVQNAEWLDWLEEMAALEQVWADAAQEQTDRVIASWNSATDELSVFAEEAARNMQDAFADFLFDPFENGVKGMLESFGNILQRMAAEMMASRVFEMLGQWGESNSGAGGWVGAIAGLFKGFGGGRALGGPVDGSKLYEVGEDGNPELFQQNGRTYLIPGNDGMVVPATRGLAAPAASSGAGNFRVVIENKGQPVQATSASMERQPDGTQLIRVVLDAVAGDVARNGTVGKAIGGRFGLQPVGVTRG